MRELPSIQGYSYDSGDRRMTIEHSSYDNILKEPSIWAKPLSNSTNKQLDKQLDKLVKEIKEVSNRRLVKVIIVDPNESIPLDKAVLVNQAEKITDLEDTEIFFDMDIKGILKTHNDYRVTVVDKEMSKKRDKDVMLEPIRIKDLKMVVLTIASF